MEENKNKKSDWAKKEEKVLEFWIENKIFEKSMASGREYPKGEFVFYEGPPTANGNPGIHHLEARSFKDAIPRYKTMQGFHVRRKGGWDTHGLPVELQVEKKLGLNSKKAIEEYGIASFNQQCKESVWEYKDKWEKFTERIGYWVDQENPYVTYDNTYIESLWNVVSEVNKNGLLYKDYKVVPWCPRCGTALSSHELAQGYEDVKDLSVYVKFHLLPGQKWGSDYETKDSAYILAWTTTPWTLPGNVALAVGNDIKYTALRVAGVPELNIVASDRVKDVFRDKEIEIVHDDIKGSDLVGLEYEPLFPFLSDTISESEKEKLRNAYKVYSADFVTTEDGTGVVHTAVMYGQDDFELGTKVGLPKHHLVNLEGKFIAGTGFLEGRFVKEKDENGKPTLAVDIINYLTEKNLFFKKENYEHSYPHCWRCKTALIYYARDSWYIRMSDLSIKSKMIEENKTINWEPAHTREGRFGEWLREIKDWAISRERYWGTPLPVWDCDKCSKREVLGSLEEIKNRTKNSGNTYYVMRHGKTDANEKGLVSTQMNSGSHLTEKGKEEVRKSAETIKDAGIEVIICSPFNRTRETTKIVAEVLGIKEESIKVDDRLGEMQLKSYEGKLWSEYHSDFPKTPEYFSKAKEGDESYEDVKARCTEALFDLEKEYQNKKILIITHGAPAWLMTGSARMLNNKGILDLVVKIAGYHYLENAEIQKLPFVPFSHDDRYRLDLHRPYIDEVKLVCDCGGNLVRTKEVMDVWFDSGAMPFAQDHYPFENKELVDGVGFPADYISEAIDQTRGWFYTLHAVGVLMGRGKAYKNVICLGHLLDANGKKMSKSLGNIVDPWEMIEKYGVDTLRLWMYSVNQPGESKNFDEKTVLDLNRQVFGLLYNVLAFYELYRDKTLETNEAPKSENILDKWVLAKLYELVKLTTENLDNYKLLEPTRAMREFMSDLSTWYLRRSRERIKEGDKDAKQTLYFVLKNVAKLLAPFAPFSAEDVWLKLRNEKDAESVHLEKWPESLNFDQDLINEMENVRKVVSLGLEARQKAGIKVRQPLGDLSIVGFELKKEYAEIVKDELNVKKIDSKSSEGSLVLGLDTNITPELKLEGDYRELVRAVQDMRKTMGLVPSDMVKITLSENAQTLVEKFKDDFIKTVGAKEVVFTENDGQELKLDELTLKVKLEK